jgi:hypothetical protein
MPWYRRNSATNTSVAGGVNNWRQIANLYRRNGSGNWEQIKRVYRKNSNNPNAYGGPGAWVLVHNSDTLNPYNTVTPEFTTDTGRFHDTAVITLTRGTWANTGTAFAPITYDLDIQYSTDNTNWTNKVTGSGTTLTYTITSNDVSPPSYYFRGRVRVKNSSSVYSGYINVLATERSYRDIAVTYLFTTMNGHDYQASWTLSKTNNATNVNTQRIEIRTNDSFTHNGVSYSPLDLVYSVTVPAGTGTQQINFLNANIKQNQSYYTELVIIANDSDQTETYAIGDDFTYQGIPVIAPFDITSFTKGTVNASSQGATRTTTLNWGAATNASKYSVQYQGRTSDTGTWSDMEIFIPYINAPTTSDTKSFTTGQTPTFVTFIRARIRASNDQGSTMIYNTSDYVEAVGTAPGQPSFGTITKTDVSASIPVNAGSQGSNYRYEQMEYQYRTSPFGSYSGTWSTQALSSGSGTITLNNLSPNQLYYIKIRNKNQDELYSPENETNFQTNAALTGATSTFISSVSRLTDTTVQVVVGSSGATGPYYQLYWNSGAFSSIPTTSYYDAASTSSSVSEIMSPSSGTSYYFIIRSSDQNFGNTTASGSQNSGSYSNYGPTSSPATYTFASPNGATSSVSGSSTVGSTLTLTANSPTSAAPAASMTSIVWVVNDGGFGGNSFTGGSVLQNGGTTFVIPQYLYGSVSSVGYSIRAEVTWNNGVGSQIANSTATAVTAAGVGPSGGSVTLSPSGTQQAGTTITANVSAMSGTATISYTTTIRKKTGSAPTSNTDGTEVASGTGTGNVASHVITASEASGTPDQFRAFTTGTNSFGNNTVASNTVISTPAVVTQYTISWNANGGTVSPGSNTVNSGTSVSAPTPTRSGYTFLYWRDSPNAFSYIYQINPGGSWTVTSNITFYAYWQAAAVAVPGQPTSPGLTGSGVVSWGAPTSGGPVDSYEIQFYTASNASGSNQAGPYFVTGIGNSPHQLTSPYGGTNANWARVQIRARNSSGPGLYGAWVPSSTTYT